MNASIRSAAKSYVIAFVVITLMMIFLVGRLRIGLVSMIPNLTPVVVTLGLMGWLGLPLDMFTMLIGSIAIGLAVDDTVHFLSKYLRARREKSLSPADAVRYAFHTVGTALWTTSIVLIAGFLVLTGSPFELNSGMGLLTAITIGLALLADFLLLPTLLMTLDKKENYVSALVADPAESAV